MTKDSKRIRWITYVKAICMLLVYLAHTSLYYGTDLRPVQLYFEPFYVNAFFIVSGYLLFRKNIPELVDIGKFTSKWKFLQNIFCKLFLTSLFFSILTFFPKMVFNHEGFNMNYFLLKTIGGNTYWFTSALIVGQLVIWVFLLSTVKNIWFYFDLAVIITVLFLFAQNNNILGDLNLWEYKQGLICLMFLTFGGIYWRYEKYFDKLLRGSILLVVLVFYLSILYFYGKDIKCITSMCMMDMQGICISIIGSILLIKGCQYLPNIKTLEFIGNNSIGFYFFCGIFPIFYSSIANKIGLGSSWIIMLIAWILSSISAILIVWIIQRYFPWMFDFGKLIKKNKKNV